MCHLYQSENLFVVVTTDSMQLTQGLAFSVKQKIAKAKNRTFIFGYYGTYLVQHNKGRSHHGCVELFS